MHFRPSVPLSVSWARLIGRSRHRRSFGHDLAVNAHGEVAFVAHLLPEAEDGETLDQASGLPEAAQLLAMNRTGQIAWSVAIHDASTQQAPALALANDGTVFLVGPYEPDADGLRSCSQMRLTRIFRGVVGESVPLAEVGWRRTRPQLALTPTGIWVTWAVDQGLRAALYDFKFSIERLCHWSMVGKLYKTCIRVTPSGSVLFWGRYDGVIANHLGSVAHDNYYLGREAGPLWTYHERMNTPWIAALTPTDLPSVITRVSMRRPVERHTTALVAVGGTNVTTLCLAPAQTQIASHLDMTYSGRRLIVAGYFSGELCGGGQSRSSEGSVFVLSRENDHTSILTLPCSGSQNGLTVHGCAAGASAGALVGYWFHEPISIGKKTFFADNGSAGFLLVKLVPEAS